MNVEWLARLPAPLRQTLYFGLQSAIGSRVWFAWREFLAWERSSPAQLNQALEQKLDALLTTAAKNSEFYRNLALFRRSGESVRGWLRRFPPLGRTKLRENFTRLVSDSLRGQITSPESVPRRRYDWLIVKPGSTAGVPTTVVHDAHARDWGRATRLYAARLCGFPLGTPYFRLWGSEQDLFGERASIQQRILRGLLAEVPMNAFRSREADMRGHLDTISAHPHIQHLMAYVDAAVELATFVQDQKLPPPTFKTIMACAGTVTPEFRRFLETTFAAEVFDKYGSRECCDMACECSHHTGLHVFSPNVFLEIVDDSGAECPPGKPGRILVTMLNNPGFPMIRYEVGDLGVWASATPCPCGSPFPRLERLQAGYDQPVLSGTYSTRRQ